MAEQKPPHPVRRTRRIVIQIAALLVVASWVPLVLIWRARVVPSPQPRIHIFQDMDIQPQHQPQARVGIFEDHRAMRPRIAGTVARGELRMDDHYYRGKPTEEGAGRWAKTFPTHREKVELNRAFLERGRKRYNIYCAVCHGKTGEGKGPVHQRVQKLRAMTQGAGSNWVKPANLVGNAKNPHIRQAPQPQPVGRIFNTISNGYNTMPGYATQIPVRDRWAIVAYIRALQLAQHPVELKALPSAVRKEVREDLTEPTGDSP